jgi:hypothetical protein
MVSIISAQKNFHDGIAQVVKASASKHEILSSNYSAIKKRGSCLLLHTPNSVSKFPSTISKPFLYT